MENSIRKIEHRKNNDLEAVLQELEQLMDGLGEDKEFSSTHPIIFIMGCARSGTTLLMQYLASLKKFCYPTNLISRFYYAPYVGALIQKMLYDLDDKKELLKYYDDVTEYLSILGKTKGILSPHEFWYYWRRFFKFGEIQKLSKGEIEAVDWNKFANGLYALQHVNDKPLALKGMILNWHVPDLARSFPQAYFIHIKRELPYNAQSLLQARKNFFGSFEEWYSFKPPEYTFISKKPYIEQVVDQVFYTNLTIEEGFSELEKNRFLTLNYEDFCQDPHNHLSDFLSSFGITTDQVSRKINFTPGNIKKLEKRDWEALQNYAKQYE